MINQDFKSILELIQAFPDEQTCIDHLEEIRWNDNVVSPFDANSKVYNCKGNRYKCKESGKYFNVKTNTIFDNTKLPLQKWFLAIWLVTGHKKGISSLQLGRDLDITQKSAWFMLSRIRQCFGIDTSEKMDGEVEADETFVGGKNKNRHTNKKIRGTTDDKTPVLGMVERNGKLNAMVVKYTTTASLSHEIIKNIKEGATLYTDEYSSYKSLQRIYDHQFIKIANTNMFKVEITQTLLRGFGQSLNAVSLECITSHLKSIYSCTLTSLFLDIIHVQIQKQKDLIYF